MRTLENALHDHELVTLRVIGEWWELNLTGADKTACVKTLASTLAELDLPLELDYLPAEEADAMRALVDAGGRIAVGTFSREHGEVRQMGPARLEREEPWLEPVSPAEALWYRGFLYRAFDEADEGGLVEYFYLPDELRAAFPSAAEQDGEEVLSEGLEQAPPPEVVDEAQTTTVDDLTTLLAFAQLEGLQEESQAMLAPFLFDASPARHDLLVTVAEELDFLRPNGAGLRVSRAALPWLKGSREQQLRQLADGWSGSSWNDLCHTPGLKCEGSGWSNDPIAARTALFDALPRTTEWYPVEQLIAHVKESDPDFQRPEGNYDTWYVRDVEQDSYLKGFENWDGVEGRLLRFFIEGPMAWLGLTDLGEGRYRLTERALAWLEGQPPAAAEVQVPLVVQADGTLLVPHNSSRFQRFQAARVAAPLPLESGQPYRYRLTPSALSRARDEGIQPERVLEFLGQASGRPIPASVKRAIERWSERGLEGQLQRLVVLRVRESSILDTLQANPRTRPYIGERLGELAAVVRSEQWREFQQVTAQLGLLLEIEE